MLGKLFFAILFHKELAELCSEDWARGVRAQEEELKSYYKNSYNTFYSQNIIFYLLLYF